MAVIARIINGELRISSPYNSDFVNEAHALDGVFNRSIRTWVFKPSQTRDVLSAILRVYGVKPDVTQILENCDHRLVPVGKELRCIFCPFTKGLS